jgi:hypothetical protein
MKNGFEVVHAQLQIRIIQGTSDYVYLVVHAKTGIHLHQQARPRHRGDANIISGSLTFKVYFSNTSMGRFSPFPIVNKSTTSNIYPSRNITPKISRQTIPCINQG